MVTYSATSAQLIYMMLSISRLNLTHYSTLQFHLGFQTVNNISEFFNFFLGFFWSSLINFVFVEHTKWFTDVSILFINIKKSFRARNFTKKLLVKFWLCFLHGNAGTCVMYPYVRFRSC